MRFYRPTIKQPISTFVEAPIEFIQGQMNVEQKRIDDASKAIADANKEYLGVQSGLYSKDLFKEFKTKYQDKFTNLSEQLMTDPSKAGLISHEIAKLNTSYKNDPLYNEISKDFINYTKAMDKLAGSDKPYYFNRTNQLKFNPDGTVESSSPSDYMALTDKGAYNTLFEQVAKLKPEVYEENGKRYVSLLNPDGTYSQQEIKTEKDVEVLKIERINKYLEDAFATTNTDGSFEYHYRDAAEKLGNPALAKDPDFRRKVYNQIVEPIKQQAYQKVQTAEIVTNLNNSSTKTRNGGNGDGTVPTTPEKPEIVSGTTSARDGGFKNPKTGNHFTSLNDFQESKDFLTKQSVEAVGIFARRYTELTGKPISTKQDYSNLFNQFKIENGKLVPKVMNDENNTLASDYYFKEGYISYFNKQQELRNIEGYERDIKKAAGVDKYDNKKIEQVTDEELIKELTTPLNLSGENHKIEVDSQGRRYLKVKKDIISKAIDAVFLSPFTDISDNYLIHYITPEDEKKVSSKIGERLKGTNEGKVYEIFNKANNRLEDVEIRQLPSKNAQGQDLKALLLQNIDIDKVGQFRYMSTNEEVDNKELREGLPKDENGKIDYSQVELGYFADPNEGMKGYMSVPINGAYKRIEFPLETSSLQSIVLSLDPTEATRFRVYNEGIKSIQESYGQKGKIKITDDFEFNFSKTNIDDKEKGIVQKYKYTDAKGITQYVDSYREMFNDLYSAYTEMNFASSEALRKLYTDLLKQYNNNGIDQITFNQKMSEAINTEKARMKNSPMGKQTPQNQDPLLLGQ